jgi:NitT/TauT family transport system ATP-binding protein
VTETATARGPAATEGESPAPPRPSIRIAGVTKSYETDDGTLDALASIDLEIAENEFVSVVGPSGCGKSTLLMIISGLLDATSGSVHIGEKQIKGPYTDLGVVFQQDMLLDWRTILGNVALQCEFRGMPRKTAEARSRELLHSVGLDGFERRRPYELSGGMRQRVALCRALVHDPPLLLMDEPFGALDALTRDQLNVDLQRIYTERRKTVVLVTHSITEAIFLSDRVVVMSQRPGRVEDVMTIALPRPRRLAVRESEGFAAYVRRVREIFLATGVLNED